MREAPRLLQATVHGRYFVRRSSSPNQGAVLVGFHGYGLNARRMLAEMRRLEGSESWNIVAVQALHPFYDPESGRVGASWMTRQDREFSIRDNVAYVDAVVRQVVSEIALEGPLAYLGFSQGAAMAHRAAALGALPADGVIAVVGDVPPELGEADLSRYPRALLGCGTRDAWYHEGKLDADVALLRSAGVEVEPFRFEGGHEWTPALRERCSGFLRTLL